MPANRLRNLWQAFFLLFIFVFLVKFRDARIENGIGCRDAAKWFYVEEGTVDTFFESGGVPFLAS